MICNVFITVFKAYAFKKWYESGYGSLPFGPLRPSMASFRPFCAPAPPLSHPKWYFSEFPAPALKWP